MKREIVTIDESKCNGCGICITACHEGALEIVDGKARLISDTYCDGLGNCLPDCPTGAITIEEREADSFDASSIPGTLAPENAAPAFTGCPGTRAQSLQPAPVAKEESPAASELAQWPCQLKLVPVQAPFFNNARLLLAADCAAYARASFHTDYMKGHVTVIGCPKLDNADYSEKLTAILKSNTIRSVSVVRMEVPCCGGLEQAIKTALRDSGKMIPWQVVTLATDGSILGD